MRRASYLKQLIRMKRYFILFGTLLAAACGGPADNVLFNQPQPVKVADLEAITPQFRGTYQGKDSSLLIIDENGIIGRDKIRLTMSRQEIDTSEVTFIDKNTIEDKKTKEKYRIVNDSVRFTLNNETVLFKFNEGNTIREHKHTLVVSKLVEKGLWSVTMYNLKDGLLYVMDVNSKDIFRKLSEDIDNEVVKDSNKIDTLKMILKPTKRNFNKILRLKDSITHAVYRKVK